MKNINLDKLIETFQLLDSRLQQAGSDKLELVICGGSALIATKLVSRTTKDVDIVALFKDGQLIEPEPLPDVLVREAKIVSENFNLPEDWLNCGPVDLFRMGLPEGFLKRLIPLEIGPCLKVHFISRTDQIHFKLYASVDRGGYHIEDLLALNPSTEELKQAAQWTRTHDVSEGFAIMLKELLTQLGFADAAKQI